MYSCKIPQTKNVLFSKSPKYVYSPFYGVLSLPSQSKSSPNKDVPQREPRDGVRFPPHTTHAQFSANYRFLEIVFQHTKEPQFIARSDYTVTFNFSVNRDLDVCTESQFYMCCCVIPVSLRKIKTKFDKKLNRTITAFNEQKPCTKIILNVFYSPLCIF